VNKNLLHRDIKPENLVLNSEEELVLVDFGGSHTFIDENDLLKGRELSHGTMQFYSPEMTKRAAEKVVYGRQADIWAAGLTLYCIAT
jgi:serine/threonine protein kinase